MIFDIFNIHLPKLVGNFVVVQFIDIWKPGCATDLKYINKFHV